MHKSGRLPLKFSNLSIEQIEAYGQTLADEDDVLASLGLIQHQIDRAHINKRWRKHWDIGYAKGKVDKSQEMYNSKDSSIQRLYADQVVPQTTEIEQVIEWTAPKWFYEELKVDKIKSARRSV